MLKARLFYVQKGSKKYANIFGEILAIKKTHRMGVLMELMMGIGPCLQAGIYIENIPYSPSRLGQSPKRSWVEARA